MAAGTEPNEVSMTKRALVIAHDHLSAAGHVGDRLAQRGYALDELLVVPAERYATPDVEPRFPAVAEYDLILSLGAPWSVNRMNEWIRAELDLLRDARRLGIPVLGICFGGQLLAASLGGSIERAPRFELGWTEVEVDEPGLVGPGPWFQFHGDRWLLPEAVPDEGGAGLPLRELARNEVASQAFVCGRSLGVQFHPELTPGVLRAWFDGDDTGVAESLGADPDALVKEVRAALPEARERAYALVDAFLERVAAA
ncbi:type 1 glutamine amidotransferase [Streptomyces violens]|uniref:type 1 glutamine amidotransferase n=1 Tax=Streptomyces violens TaxID=66377 RepID=UPI000B28FC03|nr:type 1 glutamine amidotransferase [Streptomyces violens]